MAPLGNARARAKRSCCVIWMGSCTDSRHTIASLFRPRRCFCAEAFKRSYKVSGIFFKVSVVGMESHPIATNSVPFCHNQLYLTDRAKSFVH